MSKEKPFWETNLNPIIMKYYPAYTPPTDDEKDKINEKKRKNYDTKKKSREQ